MDQISITSLTETDIDMLIPLAHRIWHAHYPSIITVEQIEFMLARGYTREIILDEVNNRGVIWLVIRQGDTMIGFASLGPYGPKAIKLHKLYLLPECHGSGIGGLALAEVERIARSCGSETLVLNVNKHNTKAIRAYLRAGWHIAEEVVVDIGDGFVMDDNVMQKCLN
jgi:ribosomal protein S18 acetylase RimI-like enzyme